MTVDTAGRPGARAHRRGLRGAGPRPKQPESGAKRRITFAHGDPAAGPAVPAHPRVRGAARRAARPGGGVRSRSVNGAMRDGAGTAFLAGLLLVGVLEADDQAVNHTKIAVKFGIGLVILILVMANMRKPQHPERALLRAAGAHRRQRRGGRLLVTRPPVAGLAAGAGGRRRARRSGWIGAGALADRADRRARAAAYGHDLGQDRDRDLARLVGADVEADRCPDGRQRAPRRRRSRGATRGAGPGSSASPSRRRTACPSPGPP